MAHIFPSEHWVLEVLPEEWTPIGKGGWGGEGMLTRAEFDEQCERAPKGWEPGRGRREL